MLLHFSRFAAGKGMGSNLNPNDLQRLAEIQRQYLQDLLPQYQQQAPSSSNSRQNNWKQWENNYNKQFDLMYLMKMNETKIYIFLHTITHLRILDVNSSIL